jgi:hypothetical protein
VVIYVFDVVGLPLHDRKSYTARGCEPVEHEEIVRVVFKMNPVQLAMGDPVGPRSTLSVVKSFCVSGVHTVVPPLGQV